MAHHGPYCAGTFSIAISATADGLNLGSWLALPEARVRLQVSFGENDPFTDLIEGYCDTIRADPIMGQVVLEGRDLTSRLLDSKSSTDYQNQTASEIVVAIANNHGLTPSVPDIAGYAGRYYVRDTTVVSLSQFARMSSDWDVLTALALAAGYDCFVSGSVLCFQPAANVENPLILDYAELATLQLTRIVGIAGGAAVTVRSWNSATQTAISETSTAALPDGSAPRKYLLVRPNLQSQDAQQLADRAAIAINTEAMVIQFSMPGDASLTVRDVIALRGTDTGFDRTYRVASIVRRYRRGSGFKQEVRAKLAV